MWPLLRGALHALPPESAHAAALAALRLIPSALQPTALGGACELLGIKFPNPVGLAAGFDKSGNHFSQLGKLGFGFVEVGTVTPKAQPGSPRPRLFRIPQARALINRNGFNNQGADHAARQLAKRTSRKNIVGINIGPNKDTPPSRFAEDYAICLRKLYGLAEYCTVNVSSPNTANLKSLQRKERFRRLFETLSTLRDNLAVQHRQSMPLLVKVGPELHADEIGMLAEILTETRIDGVVATNTMSERPADIAKLDYGGQPGGLSGAPVASKSTEAVRMWRRALPRDAVLVGAGGVLCGGDARAKAEAGANLVQLYTGLIYCGPALIAEVAAALQDKPSLPTTASAQSGKLSTAK